MFDFCYLLFKYYLLYNAIIIHYNQRITNETYGIHICPNAVKLHQIALFLFVNLIDFLGYLNVFNVETIQNHFLHSVGCRWTVRYMFINAYLICILFHVIFFPMHVLPGNLAWGALLVDLFSETCCQEPCLEPVARGPCLGTLLMIMNLGLGALLGNLLLGDLAWELWQCGFGLL